MKRVLEALNEDEEFYHTLWKRSRLETNEDLEKLLPRKKLKIGKLYFITNVVRIFLKDDLAKFIMVLLIDVEKKERDDWCMSYHMKLRNRLRETGVYTYIPYP